MCVLSCVMRCDFLPKPRLHSLHMHVSPVTALCLNRCVFWLKSGPCSPNSTAPNPEVSTLSRAVCTSPEFVLWAGLSCIFNTRLPAWELTDGPWGELEKTL